MTHLTEPLLLKLIDQVYDAALDPSRWASFLDSFSDAFRGKGVLFSQDMRSAEAGIVEFARFDPSFVTSYVEHFSPTNLWLKSAAADPEGTLVIGHQRVEPATLESSEFYNDWLRPQGLFESVGSILLKDGTVATSLSLIRGRGPGLFTNDELAFWTKLMPHVRRAAQVHRELFSLRAQRDHALEALNRLSVGVILVTEDARPLFCNAWADRILSSGTSLRVRSGRLSAPTPHTTHALQQAIRCAAQTGCGRGDDPGCVVPFTTQAGERLSVLVSPLKAEQDLFRFHSPAALVFVSDPSTQARVAPEDLVRAYGLTGAEARLVRGLLDGMTLKEYGAAAGVRISTLRAHLKQAFAKTGARRQSDLLRRILEDHAGGLTRAGHHA